MSAPRPVRTPAPVTPAPANNVIPFTKPRAISSLPVTFNPVGVNSQSVTAVQTPITNGSWGSAAVAQAAAPARLPQATPQQQPQQQQAKPQQLPIMNPWGNDGTTLAKSHATLPHQSPPPNQTPAPRQAPAQPTVAAPPPVAQEAPKTVVTPSRWAMFENLGLKAPKIDQKKLSSHVVNAYRLLGFVILTIIVIVLVGYLITTAFFYMSNSWIVPMAISPTDEKVVSLQAQLAERQTTRDRTAAELDQAERAIAVQQEFQIEFAKAIKSDLDGRKKALERMYQLASVAASTRAQVKRANSAYASQQQKRMAEEWKAGLIDRDSMLNGKFQVAQISGSNLSLAERQAEYETRAADLDAQTRSLEALLSNENGESSLSYDVLKIKQDYEASRLETARAIQNRDMLKSALEREDKLLDSLKKSSYLKALADEAHVAFVPYANLEHVKKGEPVYGCHLTFFLCGKVGNVIEVLPGEVQFKHPTRDKMLRGQMVEIEIEDEIDATDDVLFVGGRPLLL